ncbi:MAG TPA: DNA-3-methyladenine glycosylase [Verrucomicrobiae bacterium]
MPKFVPLPRRFYQPPADVVAPRLLGHWLVRNTPEGPAGGPIVEVEAYLHDDPACHAYPGPTKRNQVMFGPPGHSYVYMIYGMHFCVNAVCHTKGVGEAVLIRAIASEFGEEWMGERRPVKSRHELTNGPAKLCAALDITRRLDGADLCDAASPLFIARNPAAARFLRVHGPVKVGTRIGITHAAHLPLRFHLGGSEFVSRR